MRTRIFCSLACLALLVALGGCGTAESGGSGVPTNTTVPTVVTPTSMAKTPAPPTPRPAPAGTLSWLQDMIEYGPSPQSLVRMPAAGSTQLRGGDAVRVTQGGMGLLEFAGYGQLKLWNDTQLSQIRTKGVEGQPIDMRAYLEEGGFTGFVAHAGSTAIYTTPTHVTITVLGTEFFVTYSRATQVTAIGNFGGTIDVVAAGTRIPLPSHWFVEIGPASGTPTILDVLPPALATLGQFEQRTSELDSPLAVVEELHKKTEPTATTQLTQPTQPTAPPQVWLSLISINPPSLAVGPDCPSGPRTTRLAVDATADLGVRLVTASWIISRTTTIVPLDRTGDTRYEASIGPLDQPGELNIVIVAEDEAGNHAELSALLPVISCKEEPKIGLASTLPTTMTIGSDCPDALSMVTLVVSATDNIGIDTVMAVWGSGERQRSIPLQLIEPPFYRAEVGPPEQLGDWTINVIAKDIAGNQATLTIGPIQVTRCVDTKGPQLTLISAEPRELPIGSGCPMPQTVMVVVAASDESEVREVTATWQGPGTSGSRVLAQADRTTYRGAVGYTAEDWPKLATALAAGQSGDLVINVSAMDTLGNRSELEPIAISLSIEPCDTTGPQIEITSVEPLELHIGSECPAGEPSTVNVIALVDDQSGVREVTATWSGAASGSISLPEGDYHSYRAEIGSVEASGKLIITIVAIDRVGNASQQQVEVPVSWCVA